MNQIAALNLQITTGDFTICYQTELHSVYVYEGRSTVTQLLQILDDWTKALETGGRIDVIYTDFEKAFDKVPHKPLRSKLKSYKIHQSIVEWISNFLSDRKQRVKVNSEFSCWISF